MKRFVILCKNPALADSLRKSLRFQHRVSETAIHVYPSESFLSWADENLLIIFQDIHQWLLALDTSQQALSVLRETVVITDFSVPNSYFDRHVNFLLPGNDSGAVIGMLLLVFPEIHFLFVGLCQSSHEETSSFLTGWHFVNLSDDDPLGKAVSLSRDRMTPLFDGSGIRNVVRKSMITHSETATFANYLPRREDCAIAVDDEESFAYFNSYIAYRFGMRAYPVMSLGMMRRTCNVADTGVTLAFEDIYLNFPDKINVAEHYSLLRERDLDFPSLKATALRVIVTGIERGMKSIGVRDQNMEYLERRKSKGQRYEYLHKPLAGMFKVANNESVSQLFKERFKVLSDRAYSWPPSIIHSENNSGQHGAPGRLHAVADYLIARCRSHVGEVATVTDAIHGAVLARDALELLGNRIPTSSLEALSLQHQFETIAECKFYGIRSKFNVKSRLSDIQSNVDSISPFREENATDDDSVARWNDEANIVDELIRIFRDNNQFDEEQECAIRSRTLHRKMWCNSHRNVPFAECCIGYIHLLLKSTVHFFKAICLWICGLAFLYCILGNSEDSGIPLTSSTFCQKVEDAFYYSITSFCAIQPPSPTAWDSHKTFPMLLVCIAIASGYLHLGVFLSHIYTKITRK